MSTAEERARLALTCAKEIAADKHALVDPDAVVRLLAYVIDGEPRGADDAAHNARVDRVSEKLRRTGNLTIGNLMVNRREEPAK